MYVCVHVHVRVDGWMNGWTDGRTNGRMDGWVDKGMDGCKDRWTDGRMDGEMDGRRAGRMDGWVAVRGWLHAGMHQLMHTVSTLGVLCIERSRTVANDVRIPSHTRPMAGPRDTFAQIPTLYGDGRQPARARC